jgi:hypothetical protein
VDPGEVTVARALLSMVLLLALGSGAYLLRCRGPRPEVVASGVVDLPAGAFAAATVRNAGGEGAVEVRFRAVERRSGRGALAETSLQLDEGEVAEVIAPSPLPPGDWEVTAEAEYPPQ